MKHVLSNNITSTAKQPVIKETLKHYDNQLTEVVNALCNSIKGSSGSFIVYGCEWTYSGGVFSMTSGAVFLNGELYLSDSYTNTMSMPSVFYGGITESFESIDPILFTDGNNYNVHQTKKIVWNNGTNSVDYFTINRQTTGWLKHTITNSMIGLNAGVVVVTVATAKEINYKYDYFTGTLILDINIQAGDISVNTFNYLTIDLSYLPIPVLPNGSHSMGYYSNTFDRTQNRPTIMIYDPVIRKIVISNAYGNDDLNSTGLASATFQGQIIIY
jgi:hypothetical protein